MAKLPAVGSDARNAEYDGSLLFFVSQSHMKSSTGVDSFDANALQHRINLVEVGVYQRHFVPKLLQPIARYFQGPCVAVHPN